MPYLLIAVIAGVILTALTAPGSLVLILLMPGIITAFIVLMFVYESVSLHKQQSADREYWARHRPHGTEREHFIGTYYTDHDSERTEGHGHESHGSRQQARHN